MSTQEAEVIEMDQTFDASTVPAKFGKADQIINALVDKPEGFRLCQAGIGRHIERRLPGLDVAGLGGNLNQRVDANGFSPLSGKQIGQFRRRT